MRSQALLSVFLLFGLLVSGSLAKPGVCRRQECEDGEVCVVQGEGRDATAKCIAQEDVALVEVRKEGEMSLYVQMLYVILKQAFPP